MFFRRLFGDIILKNTDIKNPVLIDVVSGEIQPLHWKTGTRDTLESLPLRDSVMAITDESYFDWAVLPEAPSSLNVSITGGFPKLMWEIHGGNPTGILVERRIETGSQTRASWERIARLTNAATQYGDSVAVKGQRAAYRVRAFNAAGESAYSNVARTTVPSR